VPEAARRRRGLEGKELDFGFEWMTVQKKSSRTTFLRALNIGYSSCPALSSQSLPTCFSASPEGKVIERSVDLAEDCASVRGN